MPNNIDTRDLDALSGAVYFSVGRGTEGGSASYRLSVAGVTYGAWGQVSQVAYNSGYTIGTIQVDFGQRGTWPVGSIEGRDLQAGEVTYVDAVVEQASAYAQQHSLPFTDDLGQLRSDLLTHGNGQGGRTSVTFIDSDTRDSINAWASSDEGKRWIHKNMDLPQVRGATEQALAILERSGSNVSEEARFQAISILAKTANQAPGHLGRLENVLKNGGDYNDLLTEAKEIKANPRHAYFDGPKAAEIAARYASAYADPTRRDLLDRAHSKVSSPTFDPSTEAVDLDLQEALSAIGQRTRIANPTVGQLQQNLNNLGITDVHGQPLIVDGNRGGPSSRTNQAIAAFQQRFDLHDQMSNAELLTATQIALNNPIRNLDQSMRDLLPPNLQSQATRMVDGMPDYLLPGRNASAPHRNTSAQPVDAAALPPLPKVEMQQGDRGAAVLALQQHLRLIGATDRDGRELKPDRDYGARTKEAVEQFQLWTGRETTGIADKDTLQALETQAQFVARQRAQGMSPGDHMADNLKPQPMSANAGLAADPRLPSDHETARTIPASSGLQPFSDPNHPQHALYADVQQRFQAKGHTLSEAQLSVLTGQMHAAGATPEWRGDVTVRNGTAMAMAMWPPGMRADIDLTTSAPSVQDTMKNFQAEQQSMAQNMERLNQQQSMAQEHGHGLSR
jgi:peptidoglycan hydrolase-like protein with peptidoglycan-binding domain